MKTLLTIKEHERMSEEYDKVKYTCKCGHRVIIPNWVDKQICGWCGNYVFKDKKKEFEYRMAENIRRKNAIKK